MRNFYLPALLVFVFISCAEDGPERNSSVSKQSEYSGENIEKDSLIFKKDSVQTDTAAAFNVSGKAIVFFLPTEKEFQELFEKEGEESGIYEVSSDFSYYANEIIDSLSNASIKTLTTTNPVIVISYKAKVKIVDRRKLDHIVGVIFTDGVKEPLVNTGVYTDLDYWQMIKEYFGEK